MPGINVTSRCHVGGKRTILKVSHPSCRDSPVLFFVFSLVFSSVNDIRAAHLSHYPKRSSLALPDLGMIQGPITMDYLEIT